jgi:20S proteasome alpha/beta subunit
MLAENNTYIEKQDNLNNWEPISPPMTFIFGSRCTDGVVLVADRKITSKDQVESVTYTYKDKIFGFIRGVIFACAGSIHTFDYFGEYVIDRVNSTRDITYDNARVKLADIVLDINKKRDYDPRVSLELLVATQCPSNPSSLTWVTTRGAPVPVPDRYSLGIGAIYVKPLVQELWWPQISMEEAAELGWLCIKYIEYYGLHSSVGVEKFAPQIHFIPDEERNESGEKTDYEVNSQTRPELFARIKRNTANKFNKHKRRIGKLFNP